MAISMFSNQTSPIAIDFGSATVKLLQIGAGDPPNVIAAAAFEIPEKVRSDQTKRLAFLGEQLPRALKQAKFKGRRATCSIPSARMLVQHMQVPVSGGLTGRDYIEAQLQSQTGALPGALVVRTVEVGDGYIDGVPHTETICFAMPKDTVMRHVDLLRRCKLEISGVHTEQHALIWAFHHVLRRDGDEKTTTLFVDIGWGSTKVVIGHGRQLVFAKMIEVGGRHFDQRIIDVLGCDVASAKAHRIAFADASASAVAAKSVASDSRTGSALIDSGAAQMKADHSAGAVAEERRQGALPASLVPPPPVDEPIGPDGVEFDDLIENIVEEIGMCLRYHRSRNEGRQVDRVIFTGGESRMAALCRRIAAHLRLPAQLGDPLGRMRGSDATQVGTKTGTLRPGWAVACGLCCGDES